MQAHDSRFHFRPFKKKLTVLPVVEETTTISKHGELFPANGVRSIICGVSGGGKTTILTRLLEDANGLKFLNIYLFSPSINQPKYHRLFQVLSSIKEISVNFFPCVSRIPIKPHSVVIFDDCQTESNSLNFISELFAQGRHQHIDVILLVQSYAKVPKHLIRDNVNFLIVLKQDIQNLHHIYKDHIAGDVTFARFLSLAREIWTKPFGFMVIAKFFPINKGFLREGFHNFVTNVSSVENSFETRGGSRQKSHKTKGSSLEERSS